MESSKQIYLFYDGECLLCSKLCSWLRKRDKNQKFLMFTLSDFKNGKISLPLHVKMEDFPDSVLLYKSGKWFFASEAIIQTGLGLGGIHKLIILAYIIPKWLRDAVYNYIAKNRYKWFGKRNQCDMKVRT
ncbi:MAG: DUF393 domain-containing protein [Saprospiraceae bacterium]|nr:DUF393 domain-containing protein [Saprospiraceae bacterium]